MLDHLAIGKLIRQVLNERESVSCPLFLVKVNRELSEPFSFLSVHFILEIYKEFLKGVDVVACRDIADVDRRFEDRRFV